MLTIFTALICRRAHNVAEAATGTSAVSSAIITVEATAAQATESAGQVADAALELLRQPEDLSREVDGFIARIGGR
jgi:hypothetical protein